MNLNRFGVFSYLCPSLTLLLHKEEDHSQRGGEEREGGRSEPAGGWTDWGWDGRMVEMGTLDLSIQCSLTLCAQNIKNTRWSFGSITDLTYEIFCRSKLMQLRGGRKVKEALWMIKTLISLIAGRCSWYFLHRWPHLKLKYGRKLITMQDIKRFIPNWDFHLKKLTVNL